MQGQLVLLIGSDTPARTEQARQLAAEGFRVHVTNCTDEAWEIFQSGPVAAVFMDQSLIRPEGAA